MSSFNIETVAIDTLRPHPRNYRAHPQAQIEHLEASLREYGWARNVVVASDGVILAGHGIVEAARRRGETTVPVHRLALRSSDPKAEKFMVLENEVSRLADDDDAQLAALLKGLAYEGELLGTGYDGGDVEALLAKLQEEEFAKQHVDDPGADEPPDEAVTRTGDVWLCGQHRLVCGDCTEETAWATLCGDKRGRMVWTDPPYGVSYADKNEFLNSLDRGNRKQTPIANDHMGEADTEALCRDALSMACSFTVPGAAVYVACPAGTLLPHFLAAVASSGYTFKHSLVWVKNQFVLGRCDYHYRHETILYGWKEDAGHYFIDDHSKDSVFEVDKPHRSEDHPTMKPVELVAEMVANSSRPGDIVCDPFLGSGTTLIACEQLGRVCYGIEIEPRYVDVSVRRWCKATGRAATLESTGEPFPVGD